MLNPVSYKTYQPNFKANLNSPKLKYAAEDFFIKIQGYGKNEAWADKIIKTADCAVNSIRENKNCEQVLKEVVSGVKEANSLTDDESKRTQTGVLRTKRMGWFGGYESDAYTYYKDNRYSCYKQRLDYVAKIFKDTIPKFINGELKKEKLDEVNSAIAEIRWVMAHATPWKRGSDAISNVLMRAMYKAIGVKTYPSKEGVSFDLEAYCTELEDYKKNFASYFEKAPEVIED